LLRPRRRGPDSLSRALEPRPTRPDGRRGAARERGGRAVSVVASANDTLLVSVLQQSLVYGTPLLFAALGELLAERSGVLNLGVEGMMLVGAVMAFWVDQRVHASTELVLLLAVGMAALSGAILSLIHAFLVVTM